MPIWTIDLAILKVEETGKTVPEYASQVAQKLQRTNEAVRNNLNETWNASSRWYNRKVKPQAFEVDEKERVYYPRKFAGRTPRGKVISVLKQSLQGKSTMRPIWSARKIVGKEKSYMSINLSR